MQAELIYNPSGGQASVRHELDYIVTFLTQNGWTVKLRETSGPKEAIKLAHQAVENGAKVVIAAGGDGTVNEVANGLMGSDAALGVLPVGTTNVWALQMGVPVLNPMLHSAKVAKLVAGLEERISRPLPANYYRKMLLDAAKVLVEGRTVAVDVGEVSGRYFLLWAGIGLDAVITESISFSDKRRLGSWAYLLPVMEKASKYSSAEVSLYSDGNMLKINTPLIIVSNIQLYGGLLPIGAKACVNDGKLDVCVFKGEGFFTFVQHALKVLARKHLRDPKMEYFQCNEIVIESSRIMPLHVDGEPFSETPVTIRTLPSALKVIVPKNIPGNIFNQ
ncbi:diacylglycerol/lipid kinase family protein [Chloroflexota bacterium]